MITLHHGDCREIAPTLGPVDAVVTDPPYHLVAMEKRAQSPIKDRDGAMQRLIGGFMGQTWDGGDIARDPETWRTIGQALRPGGFLVAFGGTRTSHRMISAIEDAGFIIQDKLLWMFAVGFPKRRDMLKPAYEDICLAYKPGGKRTLQVDECRIGASKNVPASACRTDSEIYGSGSSLTTGDTGGFDPNIGRWPANICLSPTGGEYKLRPLVTAEEKAELYRWLSENP